MKRFRDENGKLTLSLRELHRLTHEEAKEYFQLGEFYLYIADGEKYVLASLTEAFAQFDSVCGKHLFVPVDNLGSFLPDVATDGCELIKQSF